jgi:hypothetical protein
MYPRWSWWVSLLVVTAIFMSIGYWLFGTWGIVAAGIVQAMYLLWKVAGTRRPTKFP